MAKLALTRSVIYVDMEGRESVAIVIGVHAGNEDADLFVLPNVPEGEGMMAGIEWQHFVPHDEGAGPHTWHWPPPDE